MILSRFVYYEKQKTPAQAGVAGERRLALSKKQLAVTECHVVIVPRPRTLSRAVKYCDVMGLVKVFVKIMLLLLVAAAIAGVVALVKKRDAAPVSYEVWPDVAQKTAA